MHPIFRHFSVACPPISAGRPAGRKAPRRTVPAAPLQRPAHGHPSGVGRRPAPQQRLLLRPRPRRPGRRPRRLRPLLRPDAAPAAPGRRRRSRRRAAAARSCSPASALTKFIVPVFDTTSHPADLHRLAPGVEDRPRPQQPRQPVPAACSSTATCSAAVIRVASLSPEWLTKTARREPEPRPRPVRHRRPRGREPVRRRPPRLPGPQPHHLGGQVGRIAQHARAASAPAPSLSRSASTPPGACRHHLRLRQRQPRRPAPAAGRPRRHSAPGARTGSQTLPRPRRPSRGRLQISRPSSKRCRGSPPADQLGPHPAHRRRRTARPAR